MSVLKCCSKECCIKTYTPPPLFKRCHTIAVDGQSLLLQAVGGGGVKRLQDGVVIARLLL